MKKLHKLIISSYIGPFILTFCISLFILLMQFLWKYIDDLMGKGLEWHVILELMFYASASLIPMALPLAILLSSIMTFGNLAENSELTAMKSSGLGLFRIMFPLIVVIVLTSMGAFYFSNNLWPVANLKFRSLLYDITQQKPALSIKDNVFYNGIDGFSIRVQENDSKTNTLKDVLIYDHTKPHDGSRKVIRAKTGKMEKTKDEQHLLLTLNDGRMYDETEHTRDSKSHPHMRSKFGKQVIRFDLSSFGMSRSDENLFKQGYEMLNLRQLQEAEDTLNRQLNIRKSNYRDHLHQAFIITKDSITAPTAIPNTGAHPSNFQFSKLGAGETKQVLEAAANIARTNKRYIENTLDEIENKKLYINRHQVEWHRKLTLSFACIILFFIGAPLGAIIRKGGLGLPVVFSVIFFLVYHILSTSGEKMAEAGVLEPFLGMWLSSLVLFPFGVFLTYKAARDSAIFDRENYVRILKILRRLPLGHKLAKVNEVEEQQ